MIGILRKDWLYITRNQKVYLALVLFYALYGLFVPGGETMISVLIVMGGVLAMTLFSYDEHAKWDLYALSLPVTRKQIVTARYVVVVAIVLLFTALSIVLNLVVRVIRPDTQGNDWILFLLGMLAAGLLFAAILLPICYKWGVEKGRVLMLAVLIAPSVLVMLLAQSGLQKPSPELVETLVIVFLLSSPVLFSLSYLLSVRIYQKKDF